MSKLCASTYLVWLGLEHLSVSFLSVVEQYFPACWVVGWRTSLADQVKDAW